MDDYQRIEHMRRALKRIAEPQAFYVATSDVDPEAFARMTFAQAILDDQTVESAIQKAELETRQRYPLRRSTYR